MQAGGRNGAQDGKAEIERFAARWLEEIGCCISEQGEGQPLQEDDIAMIRHNYLQAKRT